MTESKNCITVEVYERIGLCPTKVYLKVSPGRDTQSLEANIRQAALDAKVPTTLFNPEQEMLFWGKESWSGYVSFGHIVSPYGTIQIQNIGVVNYTRSTN